MAKKKRTAKKTVPKKAVKKKAAKKKAPSESKASTKADPKAIPGKGWSLVGSATDSTEVKEGKPDRLLYVLARPPKAVLNYLKHPDLRGPDRGYWERLSPWLPSITARLNSAIRRGRTFSDLGTWPQWDDFLERHLGVKPEKGERSSEFDPQVAALEAEALGVTLIWPLKNPNRMRFSSVVTQEDQEAESDSEFGTESYEEQEEAPPWNHED